MSLTTSQQLLIRACKSSDPEKRLKTFYRRFYYRGGTDNGENTSLCVILSPLFDSLVKPDIRDLLEELSPNNLRWKLFATEKYVYEEVALNYMISKIRLLEISKIEGFVSPMRFRKRIS